jgi:alcohol oxidase
MSTHDEVDIIFAGGGTAACVAAGRLAKANPDLKILLVEGGRNNFQDPTVTNPAVYLSHLAPDSKTALVFSLPASSYLLSLQVLIERGIVL